MAVLSTPGFDLIPSAEKQLLDTNYINNFNFLNQYLPDTYEKEFERYGNRTISSFLRMVGAEMPSASDLIKWAEQGRLHVAYNNVNADSAAGSDTATFTVNDTLNNPGTGGIGIGGSTAAGNNIGLRIGQTVLISKNGAGTTLFNKAIVTAADADATTFEVAYYEAAGQTFAQSDTVSVFVYGSEFAKGDNGMTQSLESDS